MGRDEPQIIQPQTTADAQQSGDEPVQGIPDSPETDIDRSTNNDSVEKTDADYDAAQFQHLAGAPSEFEGPVVSQEHLDQHQNTEISNHKTFNVTEDGKSSVMIGGQVTDEAITWEASEFIQHERSSSWYMGYAGIIIILAAGLFWLSGRDYWAGMIVLVIGGAYIFISKNPPKLTKYTLSSDGLTVGDKHYTFDKFRTFTLMQEGKLVSAVLNPIGRFTPSLSMYLPEANIDQIVNKLSTFLPLVEVQPSLVDQTLTRMKF